MLKMLLKISLAVAGIKVWREDSGAIFQVSTLMLFPHEGKCSLIPLTRVSHPFIYSGRLFYLFFVIVTGIIL